MIDFIHENKIRKKQFFILNVNVGSKTREWVISLLFSNYIKNGILFVRYDINKNNEIAFLNYQMIFVPKWQII